MPEITFSKDEKAIIVNKVQRYFDQELGQELGQFDAEFLLQFFAEEVGAYFYNRGVNDARAVMENQLESIGDALYDIEQPTQFSH